jgi:hypothetical protein
MKFDTLKHELLAAALAINEKRRELAELERVFDRLISLAGKSGAAPELSMEVPTVREGPRNLEMKAVGSQTSPTLRAGSISDQIVKLLDAQYPKSLEVREIAERLRGVKPDVKPESVRTIVNRLHEAGMIARAGHGTYQARPKRGP